MRTIKTLGAALAGIALFAGTARAQDKPVPGPASPVKLEVTIARVQGGKTVSSIPYVLTANPGDRSASALRMGSQIPVRSSVTTDGKTVPSYSYRDVGTNIDCLVAAPADGRYRVTVVIDESSVYDESLKPSAVATSELPALRSFRATNLMVLKHGQTEEFTMATDRFTGEIVKATVKLTVLP